MRPSFAMDNIAYMGLCDIELLRKRSVSHTSRGHRANMLHIGLCQFGPMMSFAFAVNVFERWLSTFASHVAQVICLCAKPEMRGIAAEWIVTAWAVMAHAFAVWNGAIVQFPTYAMCALRSISIVTTSISTIVGGAKPKPTIVWPALVNFIPKQFLDSEFFAMPLNKSQRLTLHHRVPGAISGCDSSFLSATALTKTVGDFLRGIIIHVDYLLLGIGLIRGRVASTLPGVCVAFYQSILAHLVELGKAVLHGVGTAQAWLAEVGPNPYLFAAKRLRVYVQSEHGDTFWRGWVNRVSVLLEVIGT